MYRERQKGLIYSAVFHLFMLLLAIFGLPSLMPDVPEEQPIEISLAHLPITEKSNIPISQQTPAPTPKPVVTPQPPAPEPPKKAETPTPPKPAPTPPPSSAQAAAEEPPPPPEKPKAEPVKPEPPKPEKPKPPKPKPPKPEITKAPEEDLDQVLKNLAKEAQSRQPDEKPVKPVKQKSASAASNTRSSHFDPSQQISADVRSAIMGQIAKCWNPPSGVMNAHALVVVVKADYNPDGSVVDGSVALTSASRASENDPVYRVAAEAAVRAVKECSPLKDLPQDKYNGWRSMELRFDPKNML